jgi:hypothetical protein
MRDHVPTVKALLANGAAEKPARKDSVRSPSPSPRTNMK